MPTPRQSRSNRPNLEPVEIVLDPQTWARPVRLNVQATPAPEPFDPWTAPRDEAANPGAVPAPQRDFQVGDHIRLRDDYNGHGRLRATVIAALSQNRIGLRFKKHHHWAHSCEGLCEEGRGQWLPAEYLELDPAGAACEKAWTVKGRTVMLWGEEYAEAQDGDHALKIVETLRACDVLRGEDYAV